MQHNKPLSRSSVLPYDPFQNHTFNSSQPQQAPPNTFRTPRVPVEANNGSYSTLHTKKRQAKPSPISHANTTRLYNNNAPSPTPYSQLNEYQLAKTANVSPLSNRSKIIESKAIEKSLPRVSKSTVRGTKKDASVEKIVKEMPTTMARPSHTVKNSIDSFSRMKLDLSKVAPRTPKTPNKEAVMNENERNAYLMNQLEELINKLKKQKDDLSEYMKPKTDRMLKILTRNSVNSGMVAYLTSRGYVNEAEEVLSKAFHHCEKAWNTFEEDIARIFPNHRKERHSHHESSRKSHVAPQEDDSAKAMETSLDERVHKEDEVKVFTEELSRLQTELKEQKKKVERVVEKQQKDKVVVDEHMQNLVKKLKVFGDKLEKKASHINDCMKNYQSVTIGEDELKSLLVSEQEEESEEERSFDAVLEPEDPIEIVYEPRESKTTSRKGSGDLLVKMTPPSLKVPKLDLNKQQNTASRENLKDKVSQKKEEHNISNVSKHSFSSNTEASTEKKAVQALLKELENVKKELIETKEANHNMGKVLKTLKSERNDLRKQLHLSNKVSKEPSELSLSGIGFSSSISRDMSLQLNDLQIHRGEGLRDQENFAEEQKDLVKRSAKRFFENMDPPKKMEEISERRSKIDDSENCDTTTRDDLIQRIRYLEGELKKSEGTARGQIQSLLEKLNILSQEYEKYKGQKEQSLKSLRENKEDEYGRLAHALQEKENALKMLRHENEQLKLEATNMAKQLGMPCWSPREAIQLKKQFTLGAQNEGDEVSPNFRANLAIKSREIEDVPAGSSQNVSPRREGSESPRKIALKYEKSEKDKKEFRNLFEEYEQGKKKGSKEGSKNEIEGKRKEDNGNTGKETQREKKEVIVKGNSEKDLDIKLRKINEEREKMKKERLKVRGKDSSPTKY